MTKPNTDWLGVKPKIPPLPASKVVNHAPNQSKKGPYIAILTSEGRYPFRGNHKNFADIIRTGRQMGITVYVLTPRGITPNRQTVRGYLLDTTTKKWNPSILPVPNVVYNRIPDRQAEQQPEEQKALRLLKNSPGIHLFNPSFFNKWDLFRNLQQVEQLRPYLPISTRWGNRNTFFEMLRRYPLLFLKPIKGKAGQNMIRISWSSRNSYEVIYQSVQGKQRFHLSYDQLFQKLKDLTGSQPYLLQQGISLATFRGRPFDLRVLLQKGATGKWTVTGIGTRLAGKDAISTHVPMGGSIGKTSHILRSVFGSRHQKIRNQVEALTLQFAKQIERTQNTNLGEMSMDIGIEPDGKMWFFEANSKPMKFDEPEIRSRSLQRLLQYCLFLSGYRSTREA